MKAWMAGSSPAMTKERILRGVRDKLPHRRPLDLHIFQLARHRYGVLGKLLQALLRQIGAARVADHHAGAERDVAFKVRKGAGRGLALVEEVADQSHVMARVGRLAMIENVE